MDEELRARSGQHPSGRADVIGVDVGGHHGLYVGPRDAQFIERRRQRVKRCPAGHACVDQQVSGVEIDQPDIDVLQFERQRQADDPDAWRGLGDMGHGVTASEA